jgi:flavin-dependent thymidylate synthase
MAKFGLDVDSIADIKPDIVYCSLTGFGAGAGKDLAGYDLLIQAMGGLMSITGSPDGEPTKAGVALVDVMGDDGSVVQAARVSYGEGTRKVSDDRQLIRYLLRHAHTTPFEMAEIKFVVRVPMDCWRQWIRHRTASVNEYSTRYSLAIDSMQSTHDDEWRSQASTNRQGSDGLVSRTAGHKLTQSETELQSLARRVYEERLEAGIAREQARKDLPLSTYTEWYWKTDLHNLMNFLSLRADAHAQSRLAEFTRPCGPHARATIATFIRAGGGGSFRAERSRADPARPRHAGGPHGA